MKLQHYLLIYSHSDAQLLSDASFDDTDEAVEAYAAAEETHRDDDGIEIVLVASDSFDTVKVTHANYFDEELVVSRFLTLERPEPLPT